MGNQVDTRASFPQGHIQLQTDKKFYEPGETITGQVYMRITSMVQGAQRVELEVFGQEKANFVDVERHTVR